jgi:hypothetical protein
MIFFCQLPPLYFCLSVCYVSKQNFSKCVFTIEELLLKQGVRVSNAKLRYYCTIIYPAIGPRALAQATTVSPI